jgi:hypothetical protein
MNWKRLISDMYFMGGARMGKKLLIWNIVLTVLLLAGFLGGFLMQRSFINLTNERILVISESLNEMNKVMNQHAEVISQHAKIINEHNNLRDEEYLAVIEANQEAMNDMAELVGEYQQFINENAIYFEDILENLKGLSIVMTQ